MPKYPTEIKVWETAYAPPKEGAQPEWFCGEYVVSDKSVKSVKDIKFTPVKDHNIKECVGVFGFKDKDFPAILDWMARVEKYYKDKLSQCGK